MTNPIKNNQVPPQDPYANSYGQGGPDPYAKNQGTGGPAPDPYGDSGYDPGMGGDDYGMDGGYEDEFIGDDYEGGDETGGAPVGGYSVADLREMVTSMKGTLSADQYASFMGRINASAGMSPEKQEAELAKIANELNMIANPQAGVEGMEGEEGEVSNEAMQKQVDEFKKELNSYRDDVEGMENLTEDEKTEFLGAIDKMINDIELAEKDPARLAELDIEAMKSDLSELKEAVDAGNQHSQGVKSLAELSGMTPEQLAAKAEAKGIDLNNVSIPPSAELFEFLKEISPELKQKLEAVETAVNDRRKFYEDTLRAAKKQDDDNNNNDTSTQDNTDMTHWQNLLDLRYHQDDKSKAVKDAMKAVAEELKPLFEALYPGQEVKLVETTGKSGWEKDHQDFLNADKMTIGGTQIDLFSAADGKIHSSTTADEPDPKTEIEIPTIHYDGSGTGAWKPAKSWFSLYGESDLATSPTDEAEDYSGNGLA